jgi:hypothetical protein
MDGFPRRSCLDSMTPAELTIFNAVLEVEAVGAHPRLTDAVILLAAARDAVADFVDGVTPPARPPMRLSIAFERDPENNRERPVIVDDRGARMPCVRGVQVMYDYDSASEVVIRLVVNGRDVMVGTPVAAPPTSPADDCRAVTTMITSRSRARPSADWRLAVPVEDLADGLEGDRVDGGERWRPSPGQRRCGPGAPSPRHRGAGARGRQRCAAKPGRRPARSG